MEQWTNLKIEKVWFDKDTIFIKTNDGTTKSHPLKWFPSLWNATEEQRENFVIGKWGDDIHWEELNEDLSLEGFFTYNKEVIEQQRNEVSRVFHQFPILNVSKFAESTKINRSLLASYLCNEKKPGAKKKKQIESALHQLGKDLLSVKL
jgi:hypothetical protein